MLINSGITIYQGSTPLVRVYQGRTIVWERQQPTGDIPLLYLANGADSTSGTTRDVYFDSGVFPYEKTKVEIKFDRMPIISSGGSSSNLFRGDDMVNLSFGIYAAKAANNVFAVTFSTKSSPMLELVQSNEPPIIRCWIDENKHSHMVLNETEYTSEEVGWDIGVMTASPAILGLHIKYNDYERWDGTQGGTKIYYLKIWDGDTLMKDYVPVLHNNIPCFRDNLSGTYIYNLGTDTPTYQIL